MAWYWIVLIIFGYILLSIVFGTIIAIKENDSNAAPFGLIWPFSIIMFPLVWIAKYFLDLYNHKNY